MTWVHAEWESTCLDLSIYMITWQIKKLLWKIFNNFQEMHQFWPTIDVGVDGKGKDVGWMRETTWVKMPNNMNDMVIERLWYPQAPTLGQYSAIQGLVLLTLLTILGPHHRFRPLHAFGQFCLPWFYINANKHSGKADTSWH